jgi:hypothetical protein
MKHSLKYLMLLLVGATLASAETKPTKDSAKPVPASHPAVAPGSSAVAGAKPAAAKPNLEGNLTEVKYGVKPMEPTEKDVTGEGLFQTKIAQVFLVVVVLGVLVLLILFFWPRKKVQVAAQAYSPPAQPSTGSSAELQQLSQSIQAINVRLQNIVAGQTSISSNITSLGTSLAPKVAEAAVTALTNSDLGKARQKIASLESDLTEARSDAHASKQLAQKHQDDSSMQKAEAERALREKRMAEEKFTVAEATASRLQSDLESKAALITQAQAEAATERNAAAQLRADANKGYEVLAPAKLKATDLAAQMQEMYQASLSGEVAAIAAWSALTTFASAQADPAAKDFQLQIVRRLGVVLVGYWKHQSLSEKDRHEKLSQWAKRLNEHADSRFNLLVPALGEPIDKTRMTCATSSTAIREVLCWQVRNPSGASFSLAEVA